MSSPTSASAWKAASQTVTLPSGNVAELRPALPTYMLMRTGALNKDLFSAFEQWQQGKLEDPQQASELLDLIVSSMFLNPKVTVDGKNGTVAIDQLSDPDIDRVLELAVGGLPDEAFLDGAESDAGGEDGEGVGADPVESARNGAGKPRRAKGGQSSRGKARARTAA